jgi:zinc protease
MNYRTLVLSAVLAMLTVGASAQTPAKTAPKTATGAAEPWQKIPIPPLHEFKPVEPKKIVLANGLTIFLEEDHELPFVNGSILIRGGSRDEPAAKTGLVNLYGQTSSRRRRLRLRPAAVWPRLPCAGRASSRISIRSSV